MAKAKARKDMPSVALTKPEFVRARQRDRRGKLTQPDTRLDEPRAK